MAILVWREVFYGDVKGTNVIKMNKKGFLLGEETLKIVLAVIAIGFLVFFLVSLYYSYTNDKDLKLAEASLEHLIEQINSGAEQIEIYNPKGWWLMSWPYNGVRPNSCSNIGEESCICICEGGIIKGEDKFAERCDEKGTCLGNEFTIGEGNSIKIKDLPLILTIDYENKIIAEKEE